ncbi:hypothetical protein JOB18_032927 [Solea senegalensis]|uniref:Uncharacterized protein n=1 Tax=Solea senegalensis TaxID=28829 RepID=A0AAV6QJR3_SOLSE|nr:hypothetical protein JOB18_032927 [Solea senegalensis]
MSVLSSEAFPQILVNGEQQQQDTRDAAAEELMSSNSLEDEYSVDSGAAGKEVHAKVQSVLQQVRKQIRSQSGAAGAPQKSSILELVNKIKDRNMVHNEAVDISSEDNGHTEMSADEKNCKEEEELCAIFEAKLEASKKALRVEFEEKISQVEKEMQAYTDKAVRDLELNRLSCKSNTLHKTHPKEQESKGLDRKVPTALSLASRRGRVLTRTMTTIIPKTCPPVVFGPRAKSETLASSKGASCRPLQKNPVLSLPGNKPYQSCRPTPPARPLLHQSKKPVGGKPKAAK